MIKQGAKLDMLQTMSNIHGQHDIFHRFAVISKRFCEILLQRHRKI